MKNAILISILILSVIAILIVSSGDIDANASIQGLPKYNGPAGFLREGWQSAIEEAKCTYARMTHQ